MQLNETTEKTNIKTDKKKNKNRLFDETGKRLLHEIKPLRGWVLVSALICLVLIGCAVAIPELLGALVNRLYDWTADPVPGPVPGSFHPSEVQPSFCVVGGNDSFPRPADG